VRIIAGTARGRVFLTPQGQDTRPTLNRVRESLFDVLQFRVPGARVLDLFSGSGALGLEAASRSAGAVVCNDADPKCAALIRENAKRVGLAECIDVLALDFQVALGTLAKNGEAFDLVFLDAPYGTDFAYAACEILVARRLLAAGALVAIEHASKTPWQAAAGLRIIKTRRYGECAITICEEEVSCEPLFMEAVLTR